MYTIAKSVLLPTILLLTKFDFFKILIFIKLEEFDDLTICISDNGIFWSISIFDTAFVKSVVNGGVLTTANVILVNLISNAKVIPVLVPIIGANVGSCDGLNVGIDVGKLLGFSVLGTGLGILVGRTVLGIYVGEFVGFMVLGMNVGDTVGFIVLGFIVGCVVLGEVVVGIYVGLLVLVGIALLGSVVGAKVGLIEGFVVDGVKVGDPCVNVGSPVLGFALGNDEGTRVGIVVGFFVGVYEGAPVGLNLDGATVGFVGK